MLHVYWTHNGIKYIIKKFNTVFGFLQKSGVTVSEMETECKMISWLIAELINRKCVLTVDSLNIFSLLW